MKRPLTDLNTNLVFNYENKLSHNLVMNKPKDKPTSGVYKIPCKDCEKSYIGETGRCLEKRITEHKKDIVMQKSESGVAEHVRESDHFFDFKNAKIAHYSKSIHKRDIIKLAIINKYSKLDLTVNLHKGFGPTQ